MEDNSFVEECLNKWGMSDLLASFDGKYKS